MKKNSVPVGKGEELPSSGMSALGFSGLNRSFGRVQEEFLQQLQGPRGIKVYKEMSDNDPVIGAIMYAIGTMLQGVQWTVEANDIDSPEDEAAAEFIDGCLEDMDITMDEFISEVLSMLTYGWAFFEKVFKVRLGEDADVPSKFNDGKIGWKRFSMRSQDTLSHWVFDREGTAQAMAQSPSLIAGFSTASGFEEVIIPMSKAVHFKTRSYKGNPEGRSLLRNAYRPWYYKSNIEQVEAIGIERDLAGLPVVWVPPELLAENATTSEKAVLSSLKTMITNLRRDEQEGVVFPLVYDDNNNKVYDMTLLQTSGRKQFNTNEIITRYDQRIATTTLAEFIFLGSEKFGSFSLASEKTSMFTTALGAILENIATTFTKQAIPQLLRINGMPGSARLVAGDIENRPLSEVTDFVSKLASAGALVPDSALEDALREMAGLPPTEGTLQPVVHEPEDEDDGEDVDD